MQDLKVALIQTDLYWENIEANLAMLEEKIWRISNEPDLIVLPEMFSTGFTMNANSLAEPMNSKTFRWMKQMAAQTKAVICGSYIVRENNKFFNRLVWMQPDGNHLQYDKRHLFRMGNEHEVFTAGSKKINPVLKGWKVMPLICYDLRFPIWSRQSSNENFEYDLIIYVASWPERRAIVWNTLLKARAMENLAYSIGVNRTGIDGAGLTYAGESVVNDPKGEVLAYQIKEEAILEATLSASELMDYRSKFPANRDADEFRIL